MSDTDQQGVEIVAKLMAVAARTAPKTGGADWIQVLLASESEKKDIVSNMLEVAQEKARRMEETDKNRAKGILMDWKSDASAVDRSNLLVLIGIQGRKVPGLNCGGCGHATCAEMIKQARLSSEKRDFQGPFCMFRVMDLSMAALSAAKVAMDLNVDNRIMQKVGIAALRSGMMKPCDLALGLPLSASGKNIFFDRADKLDAWKILGAKKE